MQVRPPRTPIDELPWYKSPYTWALIIGIVVLTLLRPCTRYEPDPLPSLGPVPVWLSEVVVPKGEVAIITFYADNCPACTASVEGFAEVNRRLSRTPYAVRLYVGYPDGTDLLPVDQVLAYEEGWTALQISPATDWRSGGLSRALWDGRALPPMWTDSIQIGLAWIIDDQGSLRGPLSAQDSSGIDELFHRVQHVLRESSKQ